MYFDGRTFAMTFLVFNKKCQEYGFVNIINCFRCNRDPQKVLSMDNWCDLWLISSIFVGTAYIRTGVMLVVLHDGDVIFIMGMYVQIVLLFFRTK
jgi:hypothetical protein